MEQDIEEARQFLEALDKNAKEFTFQTFDDKGIDKTAGKIHYGTIEENFKNLVDANNKGHGVFVMVQEGDQKGRGNENVKKIRCIFNENDHGLPDHPIHPQIIVNTSPGKYHCYFLVDGLEPSEFRPVQERMIADYGSDKNAKDLARVLRVPGFYHNKGDPFLVNIYAVTGQEHYTREELIKAFPPIEKKAQVKPVYKETDDKHTDLIKHLRSALCELSSDDYAYWVKIGLALHCLGNDGLNLWMEWSKRSIKFKEDVAYKTWESFHPNSIGYTCIFKDAKDTGWINPLRKLKENKEYKLPSELMESHIENDEDDFTYTDGDELAENAKAPVFFINGILETDSHGIIAGKSGAYKSFMVLNMAHSICTGADFFGNKCFDTGKVFYYCGEGDTQLSRRIKALKIVTGDSLVNLKKCNQKIRIDNEEDVKKIAKHIQKEKPALVIFDTFSSMNSETNENDNSEVGAALSFLKKYISNGYTSSIIVHHYGKDDTKGVRGAGAFTANSDFVFTMVKDGDKEEMKTKFSCDKLKDGDPFSDITAKARMVDLGLLKQDGSTATSLILEEEDYKPRGRPSGSHDKVLWESLEEAINYDARITKVGTGCFKNTFYSIAKKNLDINDSAAFKAIKKFIEDAESANKLLVFNDNVRDVYIDMRLNK